MIKIAPSLLAADLMNLGAEIQKMLDLGITRLHYDVMDAHFVPNLSFGTSMCEEIKQRFPALQMDVHLMMDNPLEYLEVFAKAGADIITLHQEVLRDAGAAMQKIKALGVKCGLSVKPKTGAETLLPCLDSVDNLLIMTVEPGFGGQEFMPDMLDKLRFLRSQGYRGDLAVDGGVNGENAPEIVRAGANVLVMGTAFFRAKDAKKLVRAIKEIQ